MKIKALTRDTNLGKLTVWFGPKAVEWAEAMWARAGLSAEVYARDQLDRYLSGGKLEPGVEVLDQQHNVPRRFVEPHPLSDGVTVTFHSKELAGIDSETLEDFKKAAGRAIKANPERAKAVLENIKGPDDKYEALGTLPVVGDRIHDLRERKTHGIVSALEVRFAQDAMVYEENRPALGDGGFDYVSLLVDLSDKYRILKRKAPEADRSE